jgi:hypothetical protein
MHCSASSISHLITCLPTINLVIMISVLSHIYIKNAWKYSAVKPADVKINHISIFKVEVSAMSWITCPEESYWLWRVVCDQETSSMRRPWLNTGLQQHRKVYLSYLKCPCGNVLTFSSLLSPSKAECCTSMLIRVSHNTLLSVINDVMSALQCCPNTSGWSTVGKIVI